MNDWVDREQYAPRENAAPGAWLPVVRRGSGGGGGRRVAAAAADDEQAAAIPHRHHHLQTMRWGLVPFFTKPGPDGRPVGSPYDHFNSRAERVREGPLTRRLFGGGGGAGGNNGNSSSSKSHPAPHHRGVAIVQGFYEWKTEAGSKKKKQGYYVQLRGGAPMRLAAVWDSWAGKGSGGGEGGSGEGDCSDGEPPLLSPASSKQKMHTFSIVTVDSSRELSWLHDRQPAILLGDKEVEAWMGDDADAAERALASVGGGAGGKGGGAGAKQEGHDAVFEWWPVTHEMNSPAYSGKDAASDVRKKRGTITSFFAPASGGGAGRGDGGGGGGDGKKQGVAGGGGGAGGGGSGGGNDAAPPAKKPKVEEKNEEKEAKG